jgi:NAD(P)-dependent dehydrogenase (short-subunit alcohol dehydrogenase family)
MAANVDGKIVLVTGASRGLGEALALALGARGARVALCATSPDRLRDVEERVRAHGADVLARALDVADGEAVRALVAAAEARWGRIDALINNASVLGARVPLREQEPAEWRRVLDVNLTGCYLTARAVLPLLRRQGDGSIINVTSGVGDEARADWGAYAVSKWALEGFSYNLAREEQDAGVRVNLVDPGSLRTAMRRAAYPDEDPARQTPPEHATEVFLWLVSDASRGVTGRRFEALGWKG